MTNLLDVDGKFGARAHARKAAKYLEDAKRKLNSAKKQIDQSSEFQGVGERQFVSVLNRIFVDISNKDYELYDV